MGLLSPRGEAAKEATDTRFRASGSQGRQRPPENRRAGSEERERVDRRSGPPLTRSGGDEEELPASVLLAGGGELLELQVIVAFAAGVAGMLALETRASSGVGVAISVTTIPAAAYLGVAVGLGETEKILGAFAVLATNVAVIVVAAAATLVIQRLLARRAAAKRRLEPTAEH